MDNPNPAVIAAVEAAAFVAGTVILDHRALTHDSLGITDRLLPFFQTTQAIFADPKPWAGVHRIHHTIPDADLHPFIEVADYLDWADTKQPARHPSVPESFSNLDPCARDIPVACVRLIGSTARKSVDDKYVPLKSYSPLEAARVLDNTNPRYFYEDTQTRKEKGRQTKNGSVKLDDIVYMLRDPHSPVLHPKGVLGVLIENVQLYDFVEKHFNNEENVSEDLKRTAFEKQLREHRKLIRTIWFAGNVATTVALSDSYEPADLAKQILIGSTAAGLTAGLILAGGNITNSLGHAGKYPLRALFFGRLVPKDDGTYSSNAPLLNPFTLDEVGGQDEHHKRPWDIAYSSNKGIRKTIDAPFGSLLELMAKHKILLKSGQGFESNQRPDMPVEAVLMIQAFRRRTLGTQTADDDKLLALVA
jgi:hypothetical protein